jgi:hypothetical protein
MCRLNLKWDLNNYNVHGERFVLDRVNTLLHDELMKAAGCSEQSVHVYWSAYCFIAKDSYSIFYLIYLFDCYYLYYLY